MTISELYRALHERYPKSLSCPWDHDGMMVSVDPERTVKKAVLSLDATDETIREAAEIGADVLVTHHPLLFRPLESVTPLTLSGRRVLLALRGGVSVFSFHTRLDAADGGVNDALATALGLAVTEKFGDEESPSLGRIAVLPEPMGADAFAAHVKSALGAPTVQLTGNRPVQKIAIVGGDGKDFIMPAILAGADTLLTGAASYNTALDAPASGLNVIEAGHYYTEAPVLHVLAEVIHELSGAECTVINSNQTTVVL